MPNDTTAYVEKLQTGLMDGLHALLAPLMSQEARDNILFINPSNTEDQGLLVYVAGFKCRWLQTGSVSGEWFCRPWSEEQKAHVRTGFITIKLRTHP